MLEIRTSEAPKESRQVTELARKPGETNAAWLARAGAEHGDAILIGGASLTHFRMRTAQAEIRHDLLPSLWSHILLINAPSGAKDWKAWEVSLEARDDVHLVPKNNGVRDVLLSAYDDPKNFPNIARLRFPSKGDAEAFGKLADHVRKFKRERLAMNIPAMMVEWFAWVWGVGERGNPLTRSVGIPSAVFVEAVYALMGVELTPGLASQSSCPEAIWQSARWWHQFYATQASLSAPIQGHFCIDQWEAAVLDTRYEADEKVVQRSLYIGPPRRRR